MRKFWLRIVLWWKDYCFKHGEFGFCLQCDKEITHKRFTRVMGKVSKLRGLEAEYRSIT